MRIYLKRLITEKDSGNYYTLGAPLEGFGTMFYGQIKVIEMFKAVRADLSHVNGGLGDLAQADTMVAERKQYVDQHNYEKMMLGGKALATFLQYAYAQDKAIAAHIHLDNIQFYQKYEWARTNEMRSNLEILGKWASKKWHQGGLFLDATVRFISRHKEACIEIVVGVVIVAGLAIATIATGGAAAPALIAFMAKGAAIMSLFGASMGIGFGLARGARGGQIFEAAADGFMFGAIGGAFFGAASFLTMGAAGAGAGAGYLTYGASAGSNMMTTATGIAIRAGGGVIADMTGNLIRNGGRITPDYAKGLAYRTALSAIGDALGFGIASRMTQTGVVMPSLNMGLKFEKLRRVGQYLNKSDFIKRIKLPPIKDGLKKVFINDIQKVNGQTVVKFNSFSLPDNLFKLDPEKYNFAMRMGYVITGYTMPSTGSILSGAYSNNGAQNILLGNTLGIDLTFKPVSKPLYLDGKVNVPDIPKVNTDVGKK